MASLCSRITWTAVVCAYLIVGPAAGNFHSSPATSSRATLSVARGGAGRGAAIVKGHANVHIADGTMPTRIPSGGVAALAVPSTSSYSPVTRWVGDIFNFVSIVIVSVMFYYFFQITKRPGCLPLTDGCVSRPFDRKFWDDGFCVNKKKEKSLFGSTHAWCFYVDLTLTALLGLLLGKHDKQIKALGLEKQYLNYAVPVSTLIHGALHFLVSWYDHTGYDPNEDPAKASKATLLQNFAIHFAIYGALFWASTPKFEWRDPKDPKTKNLIILVNVVAIVLAVASALAMNTKALFNYHAGFTAVQTLTITYAALLQLFAYPKEKKGFAYASFAGIVTFMVNVVGWVIALGCSAPKIFGVNLQDLFGHVWFDTYLASSYIIFLFTALKFMKPPSASVTSRKVVTTAPSRTL